MTNLASVIFSHHETAPTKTLPPSDGCRKGGVHVKNSSVCCIGSTALMSSAEFYRRFSSSWSWSRTAKQCSSFKETTFEQLSSSTAQFSAMSTISLYWCSVMLFDLPALQNTLCVLCDLIPVQIWLQLKHRPPNRQRWMWNHSQMTKSQLNRLCNFPLSSFHYRSSPVYQSPSKIYSI